MASASTGVEPKHSRASLMSSTIGRPAVLRLVLTSTGRPVRCSKAVSRAAVERLRPRVDRLHPGRAVHVHHGRDPLPPGRGHVVHEQHVRAGQRSAGEDVRGPPGQHHGRDRPELLPALDVVEPVEVGPPARVSQQRPVPEGAGPVLAAALEPGHHPVAGQHFGHGAGQVRRPFEGHPGGAQRGLDLGVGEAPAEAGVGHRPGRLALVRRDLQRRAQRGARRHRPRAGPTPARTGPRSCSTVLATQFSAVPPAMASTRSPVRACSSAARASSTSSSRRCTLAARSACASVSSPPGGRAGASCAPVHRVGAEAAGDRPDLLPDLVEEARLAVGGQRHHLVLVAGTQETEVGGQVLVEQAERVRQRLGGQDLELAGAVPAAEERVLLAAAVAHQHGALGRPGGQAGRGGVGDVVAHEPGPGRVQAGQLLGEELRCARRRTACAAYPTGRRAPWPRRSGPAPGRRRSRSGRRRPGVRPAWRRHQPGSRGRLFPGGERHRPLAVLAAAEALLFGGGDYRAIHDECGRGVMEDGVNAENSHAGPFRRCDGATLLWRGLRWRPWHGLGGVTACPGDRSPNLAAARLSPQATSVTAMFQRLFPGK